MARKGFIHLAGLAVLLFVAVGVATGVYLVRSGTSFSPRAQSVACTPRLSCMDTALGCGGDLSVVVNNWCSVGGPTIQVSSLSELVRLGCVPRPACMNQNPACNVTLPPFIRSYAFDWCPALKSSPTPIVVAIASPTPLSTPISRPTVPVSDSVEQARTTLKRLCREYLSGATVVCLNQKLRGSGILISGSPANEEQCRQVDLLINALADAQVQGLLPCSEADVSVPRITPSPVPTVVSSVTPTITNVTACVPRPECLFWKTPCNIDLSKVPNLCPVGCPVIPMPEGIAFPTRLTCIPRPACLDNSNRPCLLTLAGLPGLLGAAKFCPLATPTASSSLPVDYKPGCVPRIGCTSVGACPFELARDERWCSPGGPSIDIPPNYDYGKLTCVPRPACMSAAMACDVYLPDSVKAKGLGWCVSGFEVPKTTIFVPFFQSLFGALSGILQGLFNN